MTRDELISILHTKKFSCLGAMSAYLHECGFGNEITHDSWDDITVTFTYGDLEFSTSYNPWWGRWELYIPSKDGETIEETIVLQGYLE